MSNLKITMNGNVFEYSSFSFPDNEIADILEDAADYMETHGSCYGRYEDKDGRVYMEGAVGKATGGWSGTEYLNNDEFKHIIAKTMLANRCLTATIVAESRYPTVVSFSDDHTHQERLDMLRKAAKRIRSM